MGKEIKKGEIIIYQSKSGAIELRGDFVRETVWATQAQMVNLFGVDQSVVSRHINNIFKDGEIEEKSNMQKMHNANSDKPVASYSLDVILGVGYRTNSKVAIEFRKWATKTLRGYILDGYAINENRLLEAQNKFKELQNAVDFLRQKSKHELMTGQEQEILNLLGDYSKTLTLLEQYDTEKVVLSKKGKGGFVLDYTVAINVISEIKKELTSKKEASEFFGQENGEKLKGLIGTIHQTFDKKELYPSIEEKAAHLLYFIIKDHPFVHGNKRSGAFLFVYFLDKNKYLYRETGEKKINDNALTALSLLIAISNPNEKDKLIKIITNLLSA
jgi:prophage maintenance system killer protein